MPIAASRPATDNDLVEFAREATAAVDALLADAVAKVRERVMVEGHAVGRLLDREQRATHGLAWLATYVEAVRQLASYTERMTGGDTLGEMEEHLVRIALGEYLAQIVGGIPMSQGEMVRPADLGLSMAQVCRAHQPTVEGLIASGNTAERRARLVELMRESHNATVGMCGLDETLESIRDEMRKFADSEVVGNAQGWHRTNSYIPLEVIGQMSELGVFGLTIPEEFGGMGLGKESMCVVSEELSRGYIGVGSLGTRSEIAAELILGSGTERAEAKVAAEDRVRRGAADRGVHRAQYRLRSCLAQDARGARRRRLQGLRQQDLDHASGARRSDDAPGAHQSEGSRPSRPVDAARGKAARRRCKAIPGQGHDAAPRSKCSAIAA